MNAVADGTENSDYYFSMQISVDTVASESAAIR